MQVLSVVGILQDEADPMVSVMKVIWPHHHCCLLHHSLSASKQVVGLTSVCTTCLALSSSSTLSVIQELMHCC